MDLKTLQTIPEFEAIAQALLPPAIAAYVSGGAGAEATLRGNIAAFNDVWLTPRIPESHATAPATGTNICGQHVSIPVLLAPTSPQRLLHPDAELASARAAHSFGTIPIVSADSHFGLPAIAEAAGGKFWLQAYAYGGLKNVGALIDMAQVEGATAVVVTADATFPARRIRATRANFRTPADVDFGILRACGVFDGGVPEGGRLERLPMTWDDLKWIRRKTTLPLFIKGVLRGEDAKKCLAIGADGVVVSNHGGRQLDSVVPSLVALERVVEAVQGKGTILFDGGIRSGIDTIKALALGADAVCVGRPYLWGLMIAGEEGVLAVLNLLRIEIEDGLLQLGLSDITEVKRDCLATSL